MGDRLLRFGKSPGHSGNAGRENGDSEKLRDRFFQKQNPEEYRRREPEDEERKDAEERHPKTLIIYFSRRGENYVNGELVRLERGNTELLVNFIREEVSADTFRLETVKAYPEDYMACTEVAKKEKKTGARPELKTYLDNVDGYENIVVAAPCWWGTWPCAVFSQLEILNFTGKKIFPVMTHEGSGFGKSVRILKKICKGGKIGPGLSVHGAEVMASEDQVRTWARTNLG